MKDDVSVMEMLHHVSNGFRMINIYIDKADGVEEDLMGKRNVVSEGSHSQDLIDADDGLIDVEE
ncbi:conserved hypothetical protein [Ricinus communis]|uniref:Uncharacterized protein n=1 Tax=Ricinus communis TaxID=3988 RepID=B9T1M2_RICCO|nr:conserved hypothetical protein [Ricinus communis]